MDNGWAKVNAQQAAANIFPDNSARRYRSAPRGVFARPQGNEVAGVLVNTRYPLL